MNWISRSLSRFWHAYQEGLTLSCPFTRASRMAARHAGMRREQVRKTLRKGKALIH